MDLTEPQWQLLSPLLPVPLVRDDGRGRPWRDVLNGVLWVLRTGAPWADLPERYPPYQTCHRRFQAWVEAGVMEQVLHALARDLQKRGGLDLTECFVDATFASAKKGALASAKKGALASAKKGALASARPSAVRAARSWQSQTLLVFLSPYAQAVLRRMK